MSWGELGQGHVVVGELESAQRRWLEERSIETAVRSLSPLGRSESGDLWLSGAVQEALSE